MLKTPSILIDGSPPRYERLGFYMDFSGWDDPSYSTEKHAQRLVDDLGNANREPPESLGKAIDAAVELVAMRHFQFAGAPLCEIASSRPASWRWLIFRRAPAIPTRMISSPGSRSEGCCTDYSCAALANRWETFEKVCNAVRPKLASADTTDVEDADDYAQVLLLFVSNYRDRPLPKAAAIRAGGSSAQSQASSFTSGCVPRIAAGREADLEGALRSWLEYFLEMRPEERIIPTSSLNKPFQYVAIPESLFHLAALNRGLKLSPLPRHLADSLITPKSIGASRE